MSPAALGLPAPVAGWLQEQDNEAASLCPLLPRMKLTSGVLDPLPSCRRGQKGFLLSLAAKKKGIGILDLQLIGDHEQPDLHIMTEVPQVVCSSQ